MSNLSIIKDVLNRAELSMDEYAEISILLIHAQYYLRDMGRAGDPEATRIYTQLTGEQPHVQPKVG